MPRDPDPGDVATTLGALFAGIGAGGTLLAVTVLSVRGAQAGAPPVPDAGPPAGATALAVGSVAALAVAAGVAFTRAHPLGTRWQRVAVAAIAACGTVVPALLAIPLDRTLGTAGLALIAAACLALALLGWRASRAASGTVP